MVVGWHVGCLQEDLVCDGKLTSVSGAAEVVGARFSWRRRGALISPDLPSTGDVYSDVGSDPYEMR
jgi:hypothetical protein